MDKRKMTLLVNGVLAIAVLAIITYLSWRFMPGIVHLIKSPHRFKVFLDSFGSASIPAFIFFQAFQVIFAAIPGELIQLAGGYIYGTFWGTVYSFVGITLGSVAAFFIARILGFRLLKRFISVKQIERFNFINKPGAEMILFILFLIPGVPKDLLVYIAGLTPIKPMNFLTLCMLARLPALIATSYIGSNIHQKNYVVVSVVATVACLLFVLGFIFKDKMIMLMNKGPIHKRLAKRRENEAEE